MSKKSKAFENHCDLHENYGSVEELERDLSKVIDAAIALLDAARETHLPDALVMGIVQSVIMSIDAHNRHASALGKQLALIDALADMMGCDDE